MEESKTGGEDSLSQLLSRTRAITSFIDCYYGSGGQGGSI